MGAAFVVFTDGDVEDGERRERRREDRDSPRSGLRIVADHGSVSTSIGHGSIGPETRGNLLRKGHKKPPAGADAVFFCRLCFVARLCVWSCSNGQQDRRSWHRVTKTKINEDGNALFTHADGQAAVETAKAQKGDKQPREEDGMDDTR